ncbi:putative protein-tyrosine kinase, partial [Gordonia namibiensis NBRC 108229]
SASYQNSLASAQRVASYAELVDSDVIVSRALESTGVGLKQDEAKDSLSVSTSPDTVLLVVTAENANPDLAARLASGVSQALIEYVEVLEVPSAGGDPLAKLTVVSPATVDDAPVSPRYGRTVLIALTLGICMGIGIVVLVERADTRIRSEDSVLEVTELPILGDLPDDPAVDRNVVNFGVGGSPAAEAFRHLRTNLSFMDVDSPARMIAVTSPSPGDGKTTVALNLAASLAEAGHSVLLVDADLRNPSVAGRVNLTGSVGLTTILSTGATLTDCIQHSSVAGLDVLPSGPIAPNPAELLGSRKASDVFGSLRDSFEYVVVDTPPCLPVTDAQVVSRLVDGVLVVVRIDKSAKHELSDTTRQMDTAGVHAMGVVINGTPVRQSPYRFRYYGVNVENNADDMSVDKVGTSSAS